jgi:hypothetical protein
MTGIASQVRAFLESEPPLSVVSLQDLYASVPGNNPAVRAALYAHAAGSPVSRRSPPSKYYAIYLPVQLPDSQLVETFLSLPGIPHARILLDVPATKTVGQVIERLQVKYGRKTIKYWGSAAQYHSVAQARTGMSKARKRDKGICRLCSVENGHRLRSGMPTLQPSRTRSHHIVSRRALFWTLLEEVDQQKGGIFSDDATELLKRKLRAEPLHSDERFIITLCDDHDRLLLASLRQAVHQTRLP